jgi:hypothetical protein
MRTLEELGAKLEEAKADLMYLRNLGYDPAWKLISSEEKRLLHDQEHYLSEYVRTVNRQITLQTRYQQK